MDYNVKKERIRNLNQMIEDLRLLRNHICDDFMQENYGMNQTGIQSGYSYSCREIERAMDYLRATRDLIKIGMPKEIE